MPYKKINVLLYNEILYHTFITGYYLQSVQNVLNLLESSV